MNSEMNASKALETFFSELKVSLSSGYDDLMAELDIAKTHQGLRLGAIKLNQLAQRLNVSSDSIFRGTIDYAVIKQQLNGDEKLPSKYDGVNFSSRFSSIYMYEFLKRKLGSRAAELILQRYQLRESHFDDVTKRNNILLPSDFCEYVAEHYGLEAVEQMGESSLDLFSRTEAAKQIHQQVKQSEYFDFFFNQLLPGSVEKNYFWSIEREAPGMIEVKGVANAEVVESLGPSKVITSSLETLRKGFLKSVPKLYFNCEVQVIKLKSMSTGDQYDLYRIEYDSDHTGFHQLN